MIKYLWENYYKKYIITLNICIEHLFSLISQTGIEFFLKFSKICTVNSDRHKGQEEEEE